MTCETAGLVLCCEQKCKESRDNFLKFSFSMMQLNGTQSETDMEIGQV